MSEVVYLSESRVRELLKWDLILESAETALEGVAKSRAVQNPRTFTHIPNTENVLYTMPGYLNDKKYGALACKLVTFFPENNKKNIPTILGKILLFDEETGALKAVVSGTEITTWRTAAASAVATKYLHESGNNILAILGAGTQGRIHAIAFQHFFKFKEIRIWNRNFDKAKTLVEELNRFYGKESKFFACENGKECVKNADVIVTATPASEPILKVGWLKAGVHINAVGENHHSELEEKIYKTSDVYIDSWSGAKSELPGLLALGINFKAEIGTLIGNKSFRKDPERITVFQSLGMAAEDCAAARLIYDLHLDQAKCKL